MKIIITTIGLLFVQTTDDGSGFNKEMTYVKMEEVMAVKSKNYEKGGIFEFYMHNNVSDSTGWKPIVVECYTNREYKLVFNKLQKALENNRK
tara:strand:+ start:148 stop:423 length:276 start_codon:yes stop_codon:yes gene_type:complete